MIDNTATHPHLITQKSSLVGNDNFPPFFLKIFHRFFIIFLELY